MDYYEVLNIPKNATPDDIKHKYRELCYTYHPDKNKDPVKKDINDSRMKEINEAYDILRDPEKKAAYDTPSLEQMFSHLFQNKDLTMEHLFKSNMKQTESPIVLLNIKIEIGFIDSFTGISLPIHVKREIHAGKSVTFETEKMYVDITEGIDDAEIITIPNKGNIIDGRATDLRLHIHVINGDVFTRDGLNILYTHHITFKESITGFNYSITHVDGRILKLKSSAGNIIQNMERKSITGNGFKRGARKGDLIIQFKVLPYSGLLTTEQLEAFNKLF